jgi:hypothetical protein
MQGGTKKIYRIVKAANTLAALALAVQFFHNAEDITH